jgi:hypothetical protein
MVHNHMVSGERVFEIYNSLVRGGAALAARRRRRRRSHTPQLQLLHHILHVLVGQPVQVVLLAPLALGNSCNK